MIQTVLFIYILTMPFSRLNDNNAAVESGLFDSCCKMIQSTKARKIAFTELDDSFRILVRLDVGSVELFHKIKLLG